MLNTSARNCPLSLSVNRNFLLNEVLVLKRCGPKKELRATLPKVPAAGRLQGPRVQPLALSSGVAVAVVRHPGALVPAGAVRYHCLALGSETLASPTRLARQGPVSSSLPQFTYDGVNG